jgi:cytochrome b6-f complex iron-sulfur subunit
MDTQPTPSRRTVLAGAGVVVGGVAGSSVLAACGGSSSTASSGAAPAGGGSTAATGSSGSGGIGAIAALSSIPDGGTVAVENPNGGSVLLTRKGEAVTGLNARCTHQGCTVAPKGAVLHCPCHGSQFQPGTGAVLSGPATEPLAKVNVTVANGQVTLA